VQLDLAALNFGFSFFVVPSAPRSTERWLADSKNKQILQRPCLKFQPCWVSFRESALGVHLFRQRPPTLGYLWGTFIFSQLNRKRRQHASPIAAEK